MTRRAILAHVNRDHDFELATDMQSLSRRSRRRTTVWYLSGIPAGTPWSNQFGWKSDELDKIADQALVEVDPAKRKAMYGEFVKIANTDIPVLMAMEQVFVSATRSQRAQRSQYAALAGYLLG